MRGICAFAVVCIGLSLFGCADLLPWPGFESHPGAFSYTEQIPASEIAEQVRCELAEFIDHETHPDPPTDDETRKLNALQLLDPYGGAQVQLKLTTDLQGSVTYLGIDLKKLGFDSIANIITKANNNPSFQLKAQGKTTTASQIDFVVPQHAWPAVGYRDKNGAGQTKNMTALALPKDCKHGSWGDKKLTLKHIWFRLWLDDALTKFKARIYQNGGLYSHDNFYDHVCAPKLTISTQFQLLFDVTAGTNLFNSGPIILPISGLSIDAAPDYTHFLQIAFTLKQSDNPADKEKNEVCNALVPRNAPSSVH